MVVRMDVLDDLLAGTRARGGVFNLTVLDPPWGLHIVDEAPLALATLVRGSAWIKRDGMDPVRMNERDVALLEPVHHASAGLTLATQDQNRCRCHGSTSSCLRESNHGCPAHFDV